MCMSPEAKLGLCWHTSVKRSSTAPWRCPTVLPDDVDWALTLSSEPTEHQVPVKTVVVRRAPPAGWSDGLIADGHMQESLVVTLLNAKYEVDGLVHRVTYQARLLYDTPAASELPEDVEGWGTASNVTKLGGVRSMSLDKEEDPQDLGLSNVALFIDQIYCLSSMISCPFIGWVCPLPQLSVFGTTLFLASLS